MKWTEQRIMEELKKYESRKDLYRENPSLYQIARVGKFLDKVLPGKRNKWTDEKIVEELRKYKSRKEVYYGNLSLYQISIKTGYLDQIHPKNGVKTKTPVSHNEFIHRP